MNLQFTKIRSLYSNFIFVVRSKSFLKLFLSLLVFLILPYSLIIGRMIYREYKDALDWNQRFQLVRIQLLAIDIENQIRQTLEIEFSKTNKFKSNPYSFTEIQSVCPGFVLEENKNISFFILPCEFEGKLNSYFLVNDGNRYRLFPSTFLEEALLDSSFSDPNEGLFLLNQSGNYGISGFIEDQFLVSAIWKEKAKSSLQTNSNLPTLKEVEIDGMGFFLVGIPLYGLPVHLFVVSPIHLVLQPILDSLETNITTLILLLVFTFFISTLISLREIESKQKLSLILNEFPHAAILYDSVGEVLLENPRIETNLDLTDVYLYQEPLKSWLKKEVLVFLKEIQNLSIVTTKEKTISENPSNSQNQTNPNGQTLRKDEFEVLTENGTVLLLEITYQIWYFEEKNHFASGALLLVQNVTKKRLEFEREMDYAKDLQKKYLPKQILFFPRFDYEILYRPLIQVGGDYYDYIDLGNNRYIFAIGDVIGHGVKAAMMMTVLKVLFHQITRTETNPEMILVKMNEGISRHFPDPYAFVPFLFLLFDLNVNLVYYGNAGHPGMIHYTNNTSKCYEKLNPMFGMLPKLEPKVLEFPILKGDRFYLFTDGLKDVENSKKEKIWEKELMSFFDKMKENHISFVKQELDFKIRSFSEGMDLLDDITWIGIDVI
ncbi:serine/threonine protein phosphatase [Leptospira kemamanensis]|uniref:Serine/threonine protein phosphatase n=1 Tax=Leptospira kemamanensis TaxID=2484942 RepID=A0A4R9JR79_9LEPT|nr:SpoIIE family protein phosphatase [Leptospira kemamanensis]TGL54987.1 serine/threonine protein phosphatase [Leptospira kemamanensis]